MDLPPERIEWLREQSRKAHERFKELDQKECTPVQKDVAVE
jgi:hypothetical protein